MKQQNPYGTTKGWSQNCHDQRRQRQSTYPSNIEYHFHEDRRKRAKQRILTAPYIEPNNFEEVEKHGKVHQVQFKITPFAARVGEETAALFNLSLSQYCKALLYLNLGLVSEPIDRRRKRK